MEVLIALAALIFTVLSTLLAVLIRSVQKQTRTEDRVGELASDVKELVEQKDRTHEAMLNQMRSDRDATDRRLRFMEEYFMRHSMGKGEL